MVCNNGSKRHSQIQSLMIFMGIGWQGMTEAPFAKCLQYWETWRGNVESSLSRFACRWGKSFQQQCGIAQPNALQQSTVKWNMWLYITYSSFWNTTVWSFDRQTPSIFIHVQYLWILEAAWHGEFLPTHSVDNEILWTLKRAIVRHIGDSAQVRCLWPCSRFFHSLCTSMPWAHVLESKSPSPIPQA